MSLIYSALKTLDKKNPTAGASTEAHLSGHASSKPGRDVGAHWLYRAGVAGVVTVILIGGIALVLQNQRLKKIPQLVIQPVMVAASASMVPVSHTLTPGPVQQTTLPVPESEARVSAQPILPVVQTPVIATKVANKTVSQSAVATPVEHHATEKTEIPKAAVPATGPIVSSETKTPAHTQIKPAPVVAMRNKSTQAKPTTDDDINRLVATAKQAIDTGNKDAAASNLKQLAAILPAESLTLLRLRAWQALRSNNQPMALMLYGQIVDRLPDDISSSINLAVLNWDAGRHEEARRIVGRLAERRPDSDTVQSYVAEFGEQH